MPPRDARPFRIPWQVRLWLRLPREMWRHGPYDGFHGWLLTYRVMRRIFEK